MKKREQLVQKILEEKEEIERILLQLQSRLQKAPEGTIKIIKHGDRVQFYMKLDPENKNGVYLSTEKKELAYTLIQKKYDQKLLREVKKQLQGIEAFLEHYDPESLENVYMKMGIVRRRCLTYAEVPDEIYAADWQEMSYSPKSFAEGTPEHYTQKGERVRSKSEVLIANALFHAGVPYRYECPLELGNQLIHPDFTVLRLKDRKEVYWEHFGLLDDMTYRNDALTRLDLYEKNGLFLGERVLISVETYKQPLNLASINRMIRHYFLD